MNQFSHRSRNNLNTTHPDMQRIAFRALEISPIDFVVTEGARTEDRQRQLYNSGASKTMNSRHLPKIPHDNPQVGPVSHAIDVAAWVDGEIRWDWPLYDAIAVAFKIAAKELDIPLEWGGDWHTFKDGPHFQLPWEEYPA